MSLSLHIDEINLNFRKIIGLDTFTKDDDKMNLFYVYKQSFYL